jgi:hypothetical protein
MLCGDAIDQFNAIPSNSSIGALDELRAAVKTRILG